MSYKRLFLILFFLFQFPFLFSSCIPSSKQCGCSYNQPLGLESKIVGGYTAREHSWPWIVSIRHSISDSDFAFCGGSLINEKYVLTAAHCFYDINPWLMSNYFVVVGAHYINDTNPTRFKIKSVILHEKYDDDLYVNDIALLELSCRINFNNYNVGYICLPPNNLPVYPYERMNSTAAGWGRLQEGDLESYTLQQVQLPVISNTNAFCKKLIIDDFVQFCAGFIEGGKDTCQGDSGGPLMIYDMNSSTWHIAGITSYGNGCARPENPGVYTRVSMFIDWIDNHMTCSSHSSIRKMSKEILLLLFCIVLYFLKK